MSWEAVAIRVPTFLCLSFNFVHSIVILLSLLALAGNLVSHAAHGLFEPIDDHLLLAHAVVRVSDALVQRLVLVEGEVTRLTLGVDLLGLRPLVFLLVFVLGQTEPRILFRLEIAPLLHHRLQILRLVLLLDLRPHLHDGVLQFDPLLILLQLNGEIIRVRSVIVEDIVEGERLLFVLKQFLLKLILRHLQIWRVFIPSNLLEPLVGELEAADGRAADILRLRRQLHQEALVVEYGTSGQPLDDEDFVAGAPVVGS